jgi:hypothetical protein
MTKEELAARLNGRQYGHEITEAESIEARSARLVVVFGYSDDNTEFIGAFHDEVPSWDETEIYVSKSGVLPKHDKEDCSCDFCGYEEAKSKCELITARLASGPYVWETKIPHATFEIMEDGDVYCRGIVFSIDDIRAMPAVL